MTSRTRSHTASGTATGACASPVICGSICPSQRGRECPGATFKRARTAIDATKRRLDPGPALDLLERLDTAILVDEFTRRGYPDPRAAAGVGTAGHGIGGGDMGGIAGFGALD